MMFPNIDNLEYSYTESFININEDINECLFNLNNIGYYYFNTNDSNSNEREREPLIEEYNLLSNKINRSYNYLQDLDIKDNLSFENYVEKKKKIFNIIHYKNELIIDDKINKGKKKKLNRISKKAQDNFVTENNGSKEIIEISDKEKFNNDHLLKSSSSDKSNNGNKKVKHDKYSDDNLRRKCKHLVLSCIMEFINKTIFQIYNGNIGNNIYRKELLTLNKSQKSNSNIIYNRVFANKKISDILSDDISTRYTNFPPQHNKLLIERLKDDEDEDKRIYFNKLFNLTFNECLEHFIGKKSIEELKGMKSFESIKEFLGEDEEYIKVIKYYLENFEKIINNKNPRKRKKNKKLGQVENKNEF